MFPIPFCQSKLSTELLLQTQGIKLQAFLFIHYKKSSEILGVQSPRGLLKAFQQTLNRQLMGTHPLGP